MARITSGVGAALRKSALTANRMLTYKHGEKASFHLVQPREPMNMSKCAGKKAEANRVLLVNGVYE